MLIIIILDASLAQFNSRIISENDREIQLGTDKLQIVYPTRQSANNLFYFGYDNEKMCIVERIPHGQFVLMLRNIKTLEQSLPVILNFKYDEV
jgi:hypothetical protein